MNGSIVIMIGFVIVVASLLFYIPKIKKATKEENYKEQTNAVHHLFLLISIGFLAIIFGYIYLMM